MESSNRSHQLVHLLCIHTMGTVCLQRNKRNMLINTLFRYKEQEIWISASCQPHSHLRTRRGGTERGWTRKHSDTKTFTFMAEKKKRRQTQPQSQQQNPRKHIALLKRRLHHAPTHSHRSPERRLHHTPTHSHRSP